MKLFSFVEHSSSISSQRTSNVSRESNESKKEKSAANRLLQFVQSNIPNTMTFTVPLSIHGIEPQVYVKHMDYLDDIGKFFVSSVKQRIDTFVSKTKALSMSIRDAIPPEFSADIRAHKDYMLKRLKEINLADKNALDQTVKNLFVTKTGVPDQAHPSVVYLPEGGGKTVLISLAVTLATKHLGLGTISIVRYVGLTPLSHMLDGLLFSILVELCSILSMPVPSYRIHTIAYEKLLTTFLQDVFMKKYFDRQLLVAIDSVDCVNLAQPDVEAKLTYLFENLPRNVRIIVSVTQSNDASKITSFFSRMVPADYFITQMQQVSRRKKSNSSSESLDNSSDIEEKESVVPLLLRLQKSEQTNTLGRLTDFTTIRRQVKEVVEDCLTAMEQAIGYDTVSTISRYLCLAQSGLSECELLDVLSCNNELLATVLPLKKLNILRFPVILLAAFRQYAGIKSIFNVQ